MSDVWSALEELGRVQDPKREWCPHAPHPKQKVFLDVTEREAMYGGAAGGGKSDALLMAALQYVHVPGYTALVLRRTYRDLALPDAIMDRCAQWLRGTRADWDEKEKRWTFPSGASLTFGYCDSKDDHYRYQGMATHYLAFDELTQFTERQYLYLLSRLRKAKGSPIPIRARSASNPGGIGHDWVKRRFVDGHGGADCAFVPASLWDNPSLDQKEYAATLAKLDPVTRKQLLEGVWMRDTSGLVYGRFKHSIVRTIPDKLDYYMLGIDYGFKDACAFCVLGWRNNDPTIYVVRCWKQVGLDPHAAAEISLDLEKQYKFVKVVGDTGGFGKGYAEEARRRFAVPVEPADKNNKRGYIELLNGDLARERIIVSNTMCEELIAEWLELPWNDERTKESPEFDNHCADAALYVWRASNAFHNVPKAPPIKAGSVEFYTELEKRHIEWEEKQLKAEQEDEALWNGMVNW